MHSIEKNDNRPQKRQYYNGFLELCGKSLLHRYISDHMRENKGTLPKRVRLSRAIKYRAVLSLARPARERG